MLDWYREAVLRKVDGIATAPPAPLRCDRARRSPGWSSISRSSRTAGSTCDSPATPSGEPWASAPWDDDRDWEFHSAVDDSVDELVALYARRVTGRARPPPGTGSTTSRPARRRPFTLRFAYVHLIEETARHLGHMDILREYLDGTTGE